MTSNGLQCLVHILGRGRGSGLEYIFPMMLQHVTHFCDINLTTCLANGIQYFSVNEVAVAFTPVWRFALWSWWTVRVVKRCFFWSRQGNFVSEPTIPLWILSPQWRMECLSINSLSWQMRGRQWFLVDDWRAAISSGKKLIYNGSKLEVPHQCQWEGGDKCVWDCYQTVCSYGQNVVHKLTL